MQYFFVKTGAVLATLVWALSAGAIGYMPDPTKYQQALDAVVAHACKGFEAYGVRLDPHKIAYGEHEIIDSFLKGRNFYRDRCGNHHPMTGKMPWLANVLGDSFPALKKKWQDQTACFSSGGLPPLTQDELRRRLDALRDSVPPPVEPDGGMCRSSSGRLAIEVVCSRCGRSTVYPELDQIYHSEPPAFFERIAKELRTWGIPVEVDGREACPDCSPVPRDFKLEEGWPAVVKARAGIDPAKERGGTYLAKGFEMRVLARCARGTSEPGYDVDCPTYPGTLYVQERAVTVVRRERASRLDDIPPTALVINGLRCQTSDFTALALLAFVQGYDTFFLGHFDDCYPVKICEGWLRNALLLPREHDFDRLQRESLDDGRVRWTVNQAWYFGSLLPAVQKDLEFFDPHPTAGTVPIDAFGWRGRIDWNLFGTQPRDWDRGNDDRVSFGGYWPGMGIEPWRHFVVLVTATALTGATYQVYELNEKTAKDFRNRWLSPLCHPDRDLGSLHEFRTKDPAHADVLLITPWLCGGTELEVVR